MCESSLFVSDKYYSIIYRELDFLMWISQVLSVTQPAELIQCFQHFFMELLMYFFQKLLQVYKLHERSLNNI